MTYLFVALILTNLLWFGLVLSLLSTRDDSDPIATFAQASDIAIKTVRDVAEALTKQIAGNPEASHGSYPPLDEHQFNLPDLDYSDPNDGMYPVHTGGKVLEEGDFDFLTVHPEDVAY